MEETEYNFARQVTSRMTSDLNKGITNIAYNAIGMPEKITFSNGKTISYVYSADGTKLQVTHAAAIPKSSTTTAYCGNLIYEDGVLKRMLVDGGYVTFSNGTPLYYFYIQDHLGNNRVVADQDGDIEQVNHYYPYGGLMADICTGSDIQGYKYNGKELDRMHGMDTYDYGARQYDAAKCGWDRMDLLCEDDYSISPYVYCRNNPVRLTDPDGMNPIYNSLGVFLGETNEGYTGMIYIYSGNEELDFSSNSIDYWTKDDYYKSFFHTYDDVEKSYTGDALGKFLSNIMTDVASHAEGVKALDDKVFSMSQIKDRTIYYNKKEGTNFTTLDKANPVEIYVRDAISKSYEGTVENLSCSLIIHEWYSHGVLGISDALKNHKKAYENVEKDKVFYPKTTERYKKHIIRAKEYVK